MLVFVVCFITSSFYVQEDSFLCLKRPYNKAVQVFCCFNFFGYLTPSDEKFVNAVKFWLGHPVKLFLGTLNLIQCK